MASIDTVNDITPRVQYEAADGQQDFDYPFPIFQDADLVVNVDDVDQTLTTHYNVSGEGDDNGGTVSFVTPLIGGEIVTIYRSIVVERDTDVQQNGPWRSDAYNDEQDKTYLILQELKDADRRNFRLPITTEVDTDELEFPAALWADKYFTFDSNGKPAPAAIVPGTITQQLIGQLLYPITAAESLEGVALISSLDSSYPPLNVRRYGASPSATAADNTAAINLASRVANRGGGGIVHIPAGSYSINGTLLFYTTPNLGQTVFKGDGKVSTTLSYVGSGTAFGVSVANTRVYDCGISDLTVVNAGTGTVGLSLDSVSTTYIEHVTITNFPTAARLHSTIEGGCLYTRWYDVTAQMDGGAVTGFLVDALASNATHFVACRYNGPSNAVGTAWKIVDALGVTVTDCDIDQCLVGFDLTAPSGAGYTDYNIFKGNRIELCGTVYSIGTNVRFTRIFGNTYQSNTVVLSDSGTYTFFLDPPFSSTERYADTGSASGNKRFQNNADQGANPFVVIADNTSSTPGAIALQVENTSAGGILAKGVVSGVEKFSIDSGGKFGIQTVVLRQVAPTVTAGQVGLGSTTQATVGAAGGASALPATPAGYLIVNIAGTSRVIPFYPQA